MDRNCRFGASIIPMIVCVALCGCAAPQWKNADHPGYGQAEYKRDLAECQKGHVHFVQKGGYDDPSIPVFDEDAVNACMTGRGWHQVSG